MSNTFEAGCPCSHAGCLDNEAQPCEGCGRIKGRKPKTHVIKIWPGYFEAVASGRKPFEYRRDDRGYQVKDILRLREWDPDTKEYSGAWAEAEVTYSLIMPDNHYVVLGIRLLHGTTQEEQLTEALRDSVRLIRHMGAKPSNLAQQLVDALPPNTEDDLPVVRCRRICSRM